MPEIISLFEHQSILYGQLPGFPSDPVARERILEQIEQINRSAGIEILHLGHKELRANALVGILRAGRYTFEILPKIDCGPTDSQTSLRQSTVRNLLAMLSYASHIKIYEQEIAGLENQVSSWFELLTRLFAQDLHRQIQSGLTQLYVPREETLPVLRGRWDLQRQITLHSQNRHRFDVLYDVLTTDILLNQVLLFVIDRLLHLTQDDENLALLGDISMWFRSVSLLPEINPALLDTVQFNRLNNRYQPAYQLARLFLSGKITQLSAGHEPGYAFVLDMNILFERFVSAFLEQHRDNILPPEWQSAAIIQQSAGHALCLAQSEGKPFLRLRPDLLLQRRKEITPLLIADMKYKLLSPSERTSGASQADIYQMLAYAVQTGGACGLLVYPQPAGVKPIRRLLSINRPGIKLLLATLNLHVPLGRPENLILELKDILKYLAG